jgi:hypothetical protein
VVFKVTHVRRSFARPRQQQAVADRQQDHVDPAVVVNLAIERADRRGIDVVARGIGDRAVPERVVDGDDAARAHELQALLVIEVVVFLVGVDEGEIEAAGFAGGDQLTQRVRRGREVQLDAVGNAGLAPIAPGDDRMSQRELGSNRVNDRLGLESVIRGRLGQVRYSPESGSPPPTRAGRERAPHPDMWLG